MNQVKLFNSAGAQTPATQLLPEARNGGTYVDQDNRRFGYTTAGGQATFTTPANTLQKMHAGRTHYKNIFQH